MYKLYNNIYINQASFSYFSHFFVYFAQKIVLLPKIYGINLNLLQGYLQIHEHFSFKKRAFLATKKPPESGGFFGSDLYR